jgi:ubiquinone/menaquinone biosynthesis C-methylase UbiE
MDTKDNVANRYRQESENWVQYTTDPEHKRTAESWLLTDTVDAWRHHRMYACLDPLLEAYPDSEWLTVGDGRFGKDAHYIQEKGHKVLASDISDTLLRIGEEMGYIHEYKVANAEALCFGNDSFDFVLCKESYHHFPRPMLALYEMLRVARKGVALIEPNEAPVLYESKFVAKRLIKEVFLRCGLASILRTQDMSTIRDYGNVWEEVGNYVYTISEREIEKVALGMGYTACAFKGLNDYYEKGVEFEKATDDSQLFRKAKERIAQKDRLGRMGLNRNSYTLLVAMIFKQPLESHASQVLQKYGFVVRPLQKNPYVAREDS